MKYILVTGGVISGIGKGVVASSLGVILKHCGIPVTSIKIDPYINIGKSIFSFELIQSPREIVNLIIWKLVHDYEHFFVFQTPGWRVTIMGLYSCGNENFELFRNCEFNNFEVRLRL